MLAHAHANIYIYIYRCSGRRQPGPSTACVQTARACGGVGVYTFYYTCMAAGLPVLAHAHRQARTHGQTQTHMHIYFMCVYLHAYMYICICMHMYVYIYVSSAMRWCAMRYKPTGRRALTCARTRANISVGGCTVEAGGCTVAVNIYTYI